MFVLAVKDGQVTNIPFDKVVRKDVGEYYKLNFDASNSGFNVTTDVSYLTPGTYTIGIYIKDKARGKEGFILTDKILTVS